jgi:uncharacterized protein YjbI with pentapeptide repeats
MASSLFDHLRKGQNLCDLGLPTIDGRAIVEGLTVPQPTREGGHRTFGRVGIQFLKNVQLVRGITLRKVHFRRGDLREVGFISCRFDDCVFEDCNCQSMGMWMTEIDNCRFINCDLRSAALGGIDHGRPRPNRYRNVRFEECDMRSSLHSCELYSHCAFVNCKHFGTDFMGAVFEDSYFEGVLDEVIFRAKGECPKTRNLLTRTDFRKADVTHCQFIGIDIDPAMFSEESLIILHHGPKDWLNWAESGVSSAGAGFRIFIEMQVQHTGSPGIVSRDWLLEMFSGEDVQKLERIASKV